MNRMRELREAKKLNMKEAAQALQMPYTTYVNYEKGTREPNSETLIAIAKFFDVSIDYLLGKESTIAIPPGFQPMPDMVQVPRVGRIACGTPILAEQNIDRLDTIPAYLHADYTLLCVGDSMTPKFLDGDVVCIRQQPEVENGEVAAVRIGEEATLKQVFLHPDYIELRPINAEYQSIIRAREAMNDVVIEGKAVGLIRKV